jgi:hypothetical protein
MPSIRRLLAGLIVGSACVCLAQEMPESRLMRFPDIRRERRRRKKKEQKAEKHRKSSGSTSPASKIVSWRWRSRPGACSA